MKSTTAQNTMMLLDRMNGPDLRIYPERCVLVRNRNANCMRCAAACASGAISSNENGLVVDPELCIGCGSCATACPTGALEPQTPDDQALAKAAAEVARATDGTVAFVCSTAADAARAGSDDKGAFPGTLELGCLGRIDETILMELALRGCKTVLLVSGQCAACPHVHGGTLCDEIVAQTLDLLEAFACDLQVERLDEIPALEGAPGFSMRKLSRLEPTPQEVLDAATASPFDIPEKEVEGEETDAEGSEEDDQEGLGTFDVLATDSEEEAESSEDTPAPLPRVNAGGTLPQFVPTRRTRLFNCMKSLGEPQCEIVASRLLATVEIDPEKCISCRGCTVFCPTGALRKYESTDLAHYGILHQPTYCVECGTCEAMCRQGAITVTGEVVLADFLKGKKNRMELPRPDWTPNRPDQIFQKMKSVLGVQNNLATY